MALSDRSQPPLVALGLGLVIISAGCSSRSTATPLVSSPAPGSASPVQSVAASMTSMASDAAPIAVPPGWITYTAPDGSFSVAFPGPPKEGTETSNELGDRVSMHSVAWVTESLSRGFDVSYYDFALGSMGDKDQKAVFDHAQATLAADLGDGIVTDARDISSGGIAGREFQASSSTSPISVAYRLYRVGDRYYRVTTFPIPSGQTSDGQGFLDSFTLRP